MFNFDKEIESFKKKPNNYNNIFFISAGIIVIIAIFLWIVMIVLMANNTNLYYELGVFAILTAMCGSLALFIILMIYYEIFWFIVHLFHSEEDLKIIKDKANINYKGGDLFNFFSLFYYPKEYNKEFDKIIREYCKKDEARFKKWIFSGEITIKELYLKLLANKDIQDKINNEIKTKNTVKQIKEVNNGIEEKIEKNKKENIKKEISNYFNKSEV